MSRPNIVLILSDDQGYGDLGLFGNTLLQTPNLDRLGREGISLTQHYCGSPLCAPSRAALLTGRYNHRMGALSVESNRGLDRIALRERTVADRLRDEGYVTGMVGKWHNGLFDMRHHPNSRGFDEFAGFLNGGMDYYDWILDYNGSPRRSDGRYLTDVFTDEAVGFIRRHAKEPFFLYLAYNAPHVPLQAPEEDVRPYREAGQVNEGVATLYGMISRMDKGVGRVLDTLEKLGIADSTIVLFTSDNGPWLGSAEGHDMARYNGPFRGMKQDVLEGGIRVPAMVRWPEGLPGGVEVSEMVHFTDWLPTFLSAAGCVAKSELPLDGADALPLFRGETGKRPDQRFWQFNRYEPVLNCNGAVREGNWKLYFPWIPEAKRKMSSDSEWYHRLFHEPHFETEIDRSAVQRDLSASSEPELYNLAEDTWEARNLAAEHPERVARMKRAFESWFEEVEAERKRLPVCEI
ncbi:sulfatase-like hydrolase/transferase [bacterium]|nr:sulfatase-like hydrolase/transferase [bacterium]